MNNHQNSVDHESPRQDAGLLPQDKAQAINKLIRLTQNLSSLADREARALAQNDLITFSVLQDEKTLVAQHYASASEELRLNVNHYRGVDTTLLDRLQDLQGELRTKTDNNNDMVQKLYGHAQARTQNSLVTVQALAQEKPVRLPKVEKAVNENEDTKRG